MHKEQNDMSKLKRRQELAKGLADHIPIVPSSRLVLLLQQAIKWQVHTGELPMIKNVWFDDSDWNHKKKRKRGEKQQHKKQFDLVMGNVDMVDSETSSLHLSSSKKNTRHENIPLKCNFLS